MFEDSHANSEEKNAKDDVFDFDLHEVSPHGQTLLHYNVFFDHDDCEFYFMIYKMSDRKNIFKIIIRAQITLGKEFFCLLFWF